jgi:hypothetical protein
MGCSHHSQIIFDSMVPTRQQKQQWLKSVDLARKAVHFVAITVPYVSAMRMATQTYLDN